MHPKINELINLSCKDFYINITTNGYLINTIEDNKYIRQLNISLHSYNPKYKISLNQYMNNILNTINKLKKYTYISLRFWTKNEFYLDMIDIINKYYNINLDASTLKNSTKIDKNTFVDFNEEFIWPDLNNDYFNESGSCRALTDHIGILVDGTIVPCCLDSKGNIPLGNIYKDELFDVINSKKYLDMLNGFKNNYKQQKLCKKCKFH